MNSSMGERLAWARNQQGMILQQVSERSGLAIGYISQLEKGAKVNPTVDALGRLAQALRVSVAFILGEVQAPSAEEQGLGRVSGQALQVRQKFQQHYASLSLRERERISLLTLEERFARMATFLCQEFPNVYTTAVIAFQLGLSVRALNDILERNCEVPSLALSQMVSITGIPLRFFSHGRMEIDSVNLTPVQLFQYTEAVALAAQSNISPEQLVALIREFQKRK